MRGGRETSDGHAAVLHAQGAGQDVVRAAMRAARNMRNELPSAVLEVVVQGPAVGALVTGARLADEVVGDIAELAIAIQVCRNSLAGLGLTPDDVPGGIGVVPAAVAHCARRQWEGWAYVRV